MITHLREGHSHCLPPTGAALQYWGSGWGAPGLQTVWRVHNKLSLISTPVTHQLHSIPPEPLAPSVDGLSVLPSLVEAIPSHRRSAGHGGGMGGEESSPPGLGLEPGVPGKAGRGRVGGRGLGVALVLSWVPASKLG